VDGARGHELDAVLGFQRPVDEAKQHDHAHVVVEPGIDHQGLERRLGIALRRRDALDDRFQHVVDALPGLGAGADRILRGNADHVLDLVDGALGLRRGKVDLVQHRNDGDAELRGGVAVRHGLRFHSLGCVHHEERALARGERARHFVREIHVAGRVDEVQVVLAPVARLVAQRRGLGLDGDAALALEIHRVEDLAFHLARRQASGALDDAVGERGFAVVDVGDDGEVADVVH
jgi:hypothetical protein